MRATHRRQQLVVCTVEHHTMKRRRQQLAVCTMVHDTTETTVVCYTVHNPTTTAGSMYREPNNDSK